MPDAASTEFIVRDNLDRRRYELVVDGRIVYMSKTVIGNAVRITYHATILAGTHVADDSMVGAGSMLTRSTEPHWVYVGVPAHKVKEKPGDERAQRTPPTHDPMADRA